jgi:thiol-disulfide isomerase/thioredoxin
MPPVPAAVLLLAAVLPSQSSPVQVPPGFGPPPAVPPALKAPPASAPAPAAAPPARRTPRYRLDQPSVFPGARIDFPQLDVYVQGPARTGYEPGKVYVFEFFGTSCSHCEEYAQLIAELARQYGARGFEFISVTDEDADKVKAWLEKPDIKARTTWSVAADPDKSALRQLQFGTFQNFTPRFFVVKDGTVLWYGHPNESEKPLESIAAGTWDPASIREEFMLNAVVSRAKEQSGRIYKECEKSGNWQPLLEFFDSVAVAVPKRASTFELQRFGTMIGPGDMADQGYAYGNQLLARYPTDLSVLRTLARTALASPQVRRRDVDWAFAIARKADDVGEGKDSRAAEVLAMAWFSKGDREKAIEAQERALRLQTDAKLKKVLEEGLARYRTDAPGPKPAYVPPPPPPPVAPSAPGTAPAAPAAPAGAAPPAAP